MSALKNIKILVVEDDTFYNVLLLKQLKNICDDFDYPDVEFDIRSFRSGQAAINNLEEDLNIMILDYFLEDETQETPVNGDQVLDAVNKKCRNCKVIMVSGQKHILLAVEMMKKGIFDYVDKNRHASSRIGTIVKDILTKEMKLGPRQ